VNDILDYSSLENGRLSIDAAPMNLQDLVESSCKMVRQAAKSKGLEFRSTVAPDVPNVIAGDARRIRQILINLLGNAVKFTRQGSVALEVAQSRIGDHLGIDFSVLDTGSGISDELRVTIFQPFTQADSTLSRPFEGTGLGLAISRRLAEAMGGTLDVESQPGMGSRFTFRLPQASAAPALVPAPSLTEPSAPAGQEEPTPALRLPVLVVEDDSSNSFLAGKMLKHLGYDVEFARDGKLAVEAFAPGKFQAILMDMQMPVMNGLEATRQIRALESGQRVPIIALTANVMPGDRERCLESGMDEFLTKPFKLDQLSAKLEQFLGGA
jgi:CheY-like chemotaxis protein